MLVGVYRSPSAHHCPSPLPPPRCKPSAIYASDRPTTIAAEVKQQSIKVSDYRQGTPECLPSMPDCWIVCRFAGLPDHWGEGDRG
ncbi:hypothetical protein M5D96_004521 [Drosophila gunungcola]|uniref:Uncharacterized protein n=1 Tax=Drosophila gunungcola TaxID=103775 RepID=A0A9P9YU52_9MUSC|nr:hypothetical protein M5D96_004521 [Drosophila gunungcola]